MNENENIVSHEQKEKKKKEKQNDEKRKWKINADIYRSFGWSLNAILPHIQSHSHRRVIVFE